MGTVTASLSGKVTAKVRVAECESDWELLRAESEPETTLACQ